MITDAALALAQAIQDSEEFKTYKSLDASLDNMPEMKEKLEIFQTRQFALQRSHLSGIPLDETELKEVDALFRELIANETIEQYFQAELKINQVMTEVSRILGDAMNFRSRNPEQE